MPRPILKTLSSYASPMRPSDSTKRGKRRVVIRRHRSASRHVTFSPFTKLRGDSSTRAPLPLLTDGEEMKGSLSSGFTFSSATEAEKKKQSRRKEELETIQTLYRAAKRRPHSVKALLLANVPGLKQLNSWASEWLEYAKTMRDTIPWARRTRPKRRPRRLLRGPWTELDDADHKYVQNLALRSTTRHPTLLVPATSPLRSENPLDSVHKSPQPGLAPANRGSFVNLLRKEGIAVDEDEDVRQMNKAIDEDLRGVSHPMKRQRTR